MCPHCGPSCMKSWIPNEIFDLNVCWGCEREKVAKMWGASKDADTALRAALAFRLLMHHMKWVGTDIGPRHGPGNGVIWFDPLSILPSPLTCSMAAQGRVLRIKTTGPWMDAPPLYADGWSRDVGGWHLICLQSNKIAGAIRWSLNRREYIGSAVKHGTLQDVDSGLNVWDVIRSCENALNLSRI